MREKTPPRTALPTYRTAADVLEKKNGSGARLLGWTVARSLLIVPPFLAVGTPPAKAIVGGALASSLISAFTLMRIYDAGFDWGAERARTSRRSRSSRRTRSRRVLSAFA